MLASLFLFGKLTNTIYYFPADLGPGDRHTLKDIQETVRHGMDNDAFSKSHISEAMQMLKDSREVRTMGSRSSNTAAYADARATAASITDEVSPSCRLRSMCPLLTLDDVTRS